MAGSGSRRTVLMVNSASRSRPDSQDQCGAENEINIGGHLPARLDGKSLLRLNTQLPKARRPPPATARRSDWKGPGESPIRREAISQTVASSSAVSG